MTSERELKSLLISTRHNLAERRKELHALYSISHLLLKNQGTTGHVLQKVAEILPSALQCPEQASACIAYSDRRYTSGDFDQEFQSMAVAFEVTPGNAVTLTVAYDSSSRISAPELFLDEERSMLINIGEMVSVFLKYRDSERVKGAVERQVELFQDVISQGPAVAFIWELSAGWPVSYVSENVTQFGYSVDEFLDGTVKFDALIHPDDLARVEDEVDRNVTSTLERFEQRYRVVTKSGDVRWVRDWTHKIPGDDRKPRAVSGVILDITESIELDTRTRSYLNLSGNLFLVLDANGRVLDANEITCSKVEVEIADLVGQPWLERFVPAEELDRVNRYFEQSFTTTEEGVREFENDIVSASGKRFTIHWYHAEELDEQGEVRTTIAFGADVSAHRQATELAGNLAALMMQNPNPALRLNQDGDVIIANQAAQVLLSDLSEAVETQRRAWLKFRDSVTSLKSSKSAELQIKDRFFVFTAFRTPGEQTINLYGSDISQEKEIGRQLKGIADNMPGAIFEYAMHPDGRDEIDYMSPGCEQIWEIDAVSLEADPTPLWEMVLPEDIPGMRQSVQDSGENLSVWNHEWRIRPASGAIKWLRGTGTPYHRNDGATAWVTVVIDITETKVAQETVNLTLQKTVFALSAVVEARDPYTAGHEENVARIAKLIGQAMHYDANRLQGLELAAMVHDIGKIKVPAEILSKPGRLSDTEFELIKTHSDVGADLLKDIDFEWPISDIIRQHHERLDGSGYPRGLKGDEILPEARIIAVADTLEAMASHRPYRPGLGMEKACDELRRQAGLRYDPEVVEACLKLVDEGRIVLGP